MVIGSDIETLSDDELANLAQRTTLFARLTPMHKERIVTLLKREGHVVGFMGDGITMRLPYALRISAFLWTAR